MSKAPEIELTRQSSDQFMALLANTTRLADLLHLLHEMCVLEKLIPAFKHARSLLQFNEYHKYTVDEHSLQAVRKATDLEHVTSVCGEAYRNIRDKNILHLALLLHDLGKGYPEDHCEVGLRIAEETGKRLGLSYEVTEDIKFLVHNHLVMTHLAFHRDINDENMVAEFASNVGSVRLLSMLYVLTCADVAAVGPDVLTPWKYELLTNLYLNARNILTGQGARAQSGDCFGEIYDQIALAGGESEEMRDWLRDAARNLPKDYCAEHDPEIIAEQLLELRDTFGDTVHCSVDRVEGTNLFELYIGKREKRRLGLFYKITGMLASQGLTIRSADIKHIGNSLVFYWYKFEDLEFDEPPLSRLQDIQERAIELATGNDDVPPTFRTKWAKHSGRALQLSRPKIEVKIDNQTVDHATIIDVFAYEKIGLLYKISRKIYQLGLDVNYARVSTYAHQIIAVFYVTDEQGNKIRNKNQLHVIKQELYDRTKNFLEPADE
jgi:[protein-PII] uridylyltransferase